MIGFFIIPLLMSDGSSGHTWAQENTHRHKQHSQMMRQRESECTASEES